MTTFSTKEQKELIRLLHKLSFPVPLEVFWAWCKVFGTVCAEAVVMNYGEHGPEILLVYRDEKDDPFFKGWHIPGCTHLLPELIEHTLKRTLLVDKVKSKKNTLLGWFERPQGKGVGKSARGHEFAAVYIVEPAQIVRETSRSRFFPLKKIPRDLIPNQIPIIKKLKEMYL